MGGVGKSLLCSEYAALFKAAYPGGIFWLRAYGTSPEHERPEDREAARKLQLRRFAMDVNVGVNGLSHEMSRLPSRERLTREACRFFG